MKSFSKLFSKSILNRPLVKKGKVSLNQIIPDNIQCPEYALNGIVPHSPSDIIIYPKLQIPQLRNAGILARQMLEYALSLARPGISTDYIDSLVCTEIIRRGAYPSPINYCGFPKAICTSVNEVVCHGIPDDRVLLDGDILSIDVSVYLNGFHGDNCGTVIVGDNNNNNNNVSDSLKVARELVQTNKDVLDMAISKCVAGASLTEVGYTIETETQKRGFRVVEHFCGHGVGHLMHMQPLVLHHCNNEEVTLKPGMIFTIEPIIVEGNSKLITWSDGWTAATADNSRGSQFEHEILINESGPPEILTRLK